MNDYLLSAVQAAYLRSPYTIKDLAEHANVSVETALGWISGTENMELDELAVALEFLSGMVRG